MILRYVTDAPLLALTKAFLEARNGLSLNRVRMKALEDIKSAKDDPDVIAERAVMNIKQDVNDVTRGPQHLARGDVGRR